MVFTCLQYKFFENIVTSNFFFSQFSNQFWKLSAIFIKFEILVYKHFQFKSLELVVWEGVSKCVSVNVIYLIPPPALWKE